MIEMSRTCSTGPPGSGRESRDVDLVAAHEREVGDLDVEALGHVDLRAAHEREDRQLGALGRELGVVEVEVGAAHDVQRRDLLAQAPPALALAAAHDRDEPARAALAGADRQAARRAAGERLLAGHDDVGHEPLELGPRARGVGGVEPLVELVHRQASLAGGVPQRLGGALAVGVRGAQLGEAAFAHVRGRVTATSAPSANGGASAIRSPLQKRPGSYQLAGRLSGSRPIAW